MQEERAWRETAAGVRNTANKRQSARFRVALAPQTRAAHVNHRVCVAARAHGVIPIPMTELEEVRLKIKAVEFALESYAYYEEEMERRDFLRQNFSAVPGLATYFCYSVDKLQDALKQLQDEKNLLLAKEPGSGGSGQALPPQPPTHVQMPPSSLPLMNFGMTLKDVNGDLTTLSAHRGFRNFVTAKAIELGVTGAIQRYHWRDIHIYFEGTRTQVGQFLTFLNECRDREMISSFADMVQNANAVFRVYSSFFILTDFSRPVDKGGKVIRGAYSDPKHDKLSVYSSNSHEVMLGSQVNF